MLTNQERMLYLGMQYGSLVQKLGVVADLRRTIRALYHKAVKQCKRDKDKMVSESMAHSLQNSNYTEF